MFIIKSNNMDDKQLENLKILVKELEENQTLIAFFDSKSKAEEAVEYCKSEGLKASRVSKDGQQKVTASK